MFFILGLPRSRTTWLSCLLSNKDHEVYHDKSIDFNSFEELEQFCKDNEDIGIVDTALLYFYEDIVDKITDKVALVTRDIEDVKKSLTKVGFDKSVVDYFLPAYNMMLEDTRIKKINFGELDDPKKVSELYNFLGLEFDVDRFSTFRYWKISTDIEEFMKRVADSKVNHDWMIRE